MMLQSTNTLLPSGVFVWDPISNKPVPFTLNGANAPDQLVFQGTQYQPELCRTFEQHRRQALFQTLELQQQLTQTPSQRPTRPGSSITTTTATTAASLLSSQPSTATPSAPTAPTASAQPLSCLLHFAPHPTEPLQTSPTYGGLLHSIATPKATAFSAAATATSTSTQHGRLHKGVDAALVDWEEKRARKRSRVWEMQEDECLAQAAAQYGGKMWKRIAQRVQQLLFLSTSASASTSAPAPAQGSTSAQPEADSDDQHSDKGDGDTAAPLWSSPRTADQCCQRWTRVLAPRMARVRWSDRRDAHPLATAQTLAASSAPSAAPGAPDHTRADTRSLATIDTALFDRLDWHALAAQMAFHDATPAACRYRFFHLRRLAKDALRIQRRLVPAPSSSCSSSSSVVLAADSSLPQKQPPASPAAPPSASSCASSASASASLSLSPSSSSPAPLPFVSSRAHMLRIEALLN